MTELGVAVRDSFACLVFKKHLETPAMQEVTANVEGNRGQREAAGIC